MQKTIKYTTFETTWGYFGLAGTEFALLRTYLPLPDTEKVKSQLLTDLGNPQYDKSLFKTLQQQITAYFEGACVNFSPDIPIAWHHYTSACHSRASGNPENIAARVTNTNIVHNKLSPFAIRVLTACRDIKFGQTISYGQLAHKVGRPKAARAIGRVMAKNPLPLIIPCHRIIRTDTKLGGFSAPGGVTLKKRLIDLEHQSSSQVF